MATYSYVMVCPRCDRPYPSEISLNDSLEQVKKHVSGQHPDHDPLWFETYPEAIVSDFTAYLKLKGDSTQ